VLVLYRERLSRSIDIYRGDAFQFDGKSDGKNLDLTTSEFFTVSALWLLTVKKWDEKQYGTTT
jgi:hypothetical protein